VVPDGLKRVLATLFELRLEINGANAWQFASAVVNASENLRVLVIGDGGGGRIHEHLVEVTAGALHLRCLVLTAENPCPGLASVAMGPPRLRLLQVPAIRHLETISQTRTTSLQHVALSRYNAPTAETALVIAQLVASAQLTSLAISGSEQASVSPYSRQLTVRR